MMSYRYFFASSRIKQRLGPLDGLAEKRVFDGGVDNEVHRSLEELLQRLHEAEVPVGLPRAGRCLELDKEIEVAVFGAKCPGCGRAEEFEAAHPEAAAQGFQITPPLFDFVDHRCSPPAKA